MSKWTFFLSLCASTFLLLPLTKFHAQIVSSFTILHPPQFLHPEFASLGHKKNLAMAYFGQTYSGQFLFWPTFLVLSVLSRSSSSFLLLLLLLLLLLVLLFPSLVCSVLPEPQTLKPSNPQTLKPSNPETLKP